MFRIVRTEKKREVYVDSRRIFLDTVGNSGEWGECPADVAEARMQDFLEDWGLDEANAEPNQG